MTTEFENYRATLWPLPIRHRTVADDMRRLGVELEFIGLPLATIGEISQRLLGGTIEQISDYELLLRDSDLGDFGIELDYSYLKQLGRKRGDAKPGDLNNLAEHFLALVARQIVPYEIVSPPIPMDQLWQIDSLFKALREAGAKGTNHAVEYAFGLHLNPEMPDFEAPTVLAYLQAFVVFQAWLRDRSDIDFTRWVTPYVDDFGTDYIRHIVAPDYNPNMNTLMDDYLRFNPTRNRALDMLPLFAHIDENRVRAAVDDDRIKSRPALHYRLPDCLIDEPDWGLIKPWRDWLQIELLANDPTRLKQACQRYSRHLARPTERLFDSWLAISGEYLLPELL